MPSRAWSGEAALPAMLNCVEARRAARSIRPGLEQSLDTAYIGHEDCLLHEMGAQHPECPARLQAIAMPGSVLVSEEVSKQLRSRRDVPRVEVGQVRLKNVDEPMRVYALALPGLRQPSLAEIASRARESGGGGSTEREMMPMRRATTIASLISRSFNP